MHSFALSTLAKSVRHWTEQRKFSKGRAQLPLDLPPTTLSTRSFRSRALRFPGPNLCLKRLVLFRQRIAGSCHCFEIVSQLAVLFLKVRHMGLQLLVLLQGFCVLAGSQGQTQHYRHGKSRPTVFARHSSSFLHKNLNRKWSNR